MVVMMMKDEVIQYLDKTNRLSFRPSDISLLNSFFSCTDILTNFFLTLTSCNLLTTRYLRVFLTVSDFKTLKLKLQIQSLKYEDYLFVCLP